MRTATAENPDPVPKRRALHPLRLVAETVGTPRDAAQKLARLARVLGGYGRRAELARRLALLEKRGVIPAAPTALQLAVGGYDMLRFWIAPASAEYYAQQGIDFTFHQVLRFLDEPASLVDPVGFFSERDGIIGHLMQVVHANPVYDLELLEMFDDGLDELEDQLEAMIRGDHPRARAIVAIVEEPEYHRRLLAFVRAFRADPTVPPLLRSNVGAAPRWSSLERTFGSLRTASRYFLRMPTSPLAALRHLATTQSFPEHLAEPDRAASPLPTGRGTPPPA